MFQSPVDVALFAGVILLLFGPKDRRDPPFAIKPETYEPNQNSPLEPFKARVQDLFISRKNGD